MDLLGPAVCASMPRTSNRATQRDARRKSSCWRGRIARPGTESPNTANALADSAAYDGYRKMCCKMRRAHGHCAMPQNFAMTGAWSEGARGSANVLKVPLRGCMSMRSIVRRKTETTMKIRPPATRPLTSCLRAKRSKVTSVYELCDKDGNVVTFTNHQC